MQAGPKVRLLTRTCSNIFPTWFPHIPHREKCVTVPEQKCQTVPKTECNTVPREQCQEVCENIFWCKVRILYSILEY